jgi:hypothetical protein
VVNVTNRAHVHVRLGALELCLGHGLPQCRVKQKELRPERRALRPGSGIRTS